MKLTPKQEAAVEWLRHHPDATVDHLCRAADVSPAHNNESEFIRRLIDKGALRLVVDVRAAAEDDDDA